MTKTSVGARQYLRVLAKLFNGAGEVSEALMNDLFRYYQKKKYLKQSVRRLMDRNFMQHRDRKFVLTPQGVFLFKKIVLADAPFVKDDWDGKWRLISFDVPGNYNALRDRLRALLKELDFYPVQKSVWVRPNLLTEPFWELLVEEDLAKYCKAMVVDIIEGGEELARYFEIG